MSIIRYLFAVAVYINLMDHRTLCIHCLNLLRCNILALSKIYHNTHKVQVRKPSSCAKIAVRQLSKKKIATVSLVSIIKK